MAAELRRCYGRCCHLVDNRPVPKTDYEKAFQNQVEILIPCRTMPAGEFGKNVEEAVGFYLGAPMRRAYEMLLPAGGPIVYSNATGERLREASAEDIKKWNDEWKRFVAEAKS